MTVGVEYAEAFELGEYGSNREKGLRKKLKQSLANTQVAQPLGWQPTHDLPSGQTMNLKYYSKGC